jgi:LmbE family N-acetylglucosaminyl deacetylase
MTSAALGMTPLASVAGAQQPIGSVALGDLVQGLGVNTRVLVIGAHPDDEDTYLISWLARGKHVETAYLSLTRGEGGQNLIGNDLGYALGQIRTEELLAARRIDGGHQYFTRAVDFGFSKSLAEANERWPKDAILKDVVSIVRTFRPHVIVSIWTGTEADGHGHHQYAGVIAKEAFIAAGDTSYQTPGIAAWAPVKLYRVARVGNGGSVTLNAAASPGTVKFNVGQYDPLFGRSYAEIAAQSRSQHRSQGQGMVLPLGTLWDGLTLDTSRVELTRAADTSIFSGIDTTWMRFRSAESPLMMAGIDSLRAAIEEARESYDAFEPSAAIAPLSRVLRLSREVRRALGCLAVDGVRVRCGGLPGDLMTSLITTGDRASRAIVLAAGVTVDALADREKVAVHDSVGVVLAVYNRGRAAVQLTSAQLNVESAAFDLMPGPARGGGAALLVDVMRDSVLRLGGRVEMPSVTYPWWLMYGVDRQYPMYDLQDVPGARRGGLPREMLIGDDRVFPSAVTARLNIDGTEVDVIAPVVYRFADPASGERRYPMVGVPRITTVFQSAVEYIRANMPVDRGIRVELTSAWSKPDTVNVQLALPRGLRPDTGIRRVILPPFGKTSVFFRVRGSVPQNVYKLVARVTDRAGAYQQGFIDILYDHINPVRYYEPPEVNLSAVNLKVPAGLEVAYLRGVGDNVQVMLEQLGVKVKSITADALPTLDPRAFTTLVIGPRAFESNDAVAASSAFIQDYARRGGTVVVQYQQVANQPGVLPFPVTLTRPADRVTDENAKVTFLSPNHRILTQPNRITQDDFADWGQERALYMPHTFDPAWKALFEMHDPGEGPNQGALLVAPLGKGTFIYTTLSFFRQLPGGNPGAARLFVNLLSGGRAAGQPTGR